MQNTGRWLRIGAWIALAALLVVAGLSAFKARFTIVEEEPVSFTNIVIHAVVRATLVEGPGPDEIFPTNDRWVATVDEVLWDRDEFTIVGGRKAQFDLDSGRIELSVPPRYEVVAGETYILAITRAYWEDPVEQAKWPWQYRVGLTSSEGYEPIGGTDGRYIMELDLMTRLGETRLDVMVAFASEQAAFQEAMNTGTPRPETPRADLLQVGR